MKKKTEMPIEDMPKIADKLLHVYVNEVCSKTSDLSAVLCIIAGSLAELCILLSVHSHLPVKTISKILSKGTGSAIEMLEREGLDEILRVKYMKRQWKREGELIRKRNERRRAEQ